MLHYVPTLCTIKIQNVSSKYSKYFSADAEETQKPNKMKEQVVTMFSVELDRYHFRAIIISWHCPFFRSTLLDSLFQNSQGRSSPPMCGHFCPNIFLVFYIYLVPLPPLRGQYTELYCALPGGNPLKNLQSLPCSEEGPDSDPGRLHYSPVHCQLSRHPYYRVDTLSHNQRDQSIINSVFVTKGGVV